MQNEKLVNLCDRILYSDLGELGYDVSKLEAERNSLIDFMHKITKGKQGKYVSKTTTHGKQRTLSKDEIDEHYIKALAKIVNDIPNAKDKKRVVDAIIAGFTKS